MQRAIEQLVFAFGIGWSIGMSAAFAATFLAGLILPEWIFINGLHELPWPIRLFCLISHVLGCLAFCYLGRKS